MIKSKTPARFQFNYSSTTHLDQALKSRLSLAQRLPTKTCLFSRNLWVEEKRDLHTYFFPRAHVCPAIACCCHFRIIGPDLTFFVEINWFCDFAWTFFHAACPKCSLQQLASCNMSERSAWPCVTDRKFCFGRNISVEKRNEAKEKDFVAWQTINTRQATHNKNAPIDDAAVPRSFLFVDCHEREVLEKLKQGLKPGSNIQIITKAIDIGIDGIYQASIRRWWDRTSKY